MRLLIPAIAAACLLAMPAVSSADDHLFQATVAGGLHFVGEDVANKNDHIIPDAPGQGSPFTGEHQCTPATDTDAAQDHANVKPKGPDAGDCAAD